MEEQKVEIKTKARSLIILLIIAVIVIIGLVGYICYDIGNSTANNQLSDNNIQNEEANDEGGKQEEDNTPDEDTGNTVDKTEDNSSSKCEEKVSKCYGTYYGEANGTLSNGISYTYVLNADGTFTANFGSSGTKGVFVINDNTISLIGQKEIVGPRDEDPYYSSVDYVIANDCSYIKVNDGSVSFKLNKR